MALDSVLSETEKLALRDDGALLKRRLVGGEMVNEARELIEHWLMNSMDPNDIVAYNQKTFAPEFGSDPRLLRLFEDSAISSIVRDLIGEIEPITKVQIQIRMPEKLGMSQEPKAMHVDGVACPHLDPEELRTFTLLVGVVLSEIDDPAGGALRFVKGGHLDMAQWFRDEWSVGLTAQVPPDIDAKDGVPVLGSPGDALFMHHLVPHSAGLNTNDRPRIMAYFRVAHAEHKNQKLEALKDPWLEFPGLRAA